MSNQKNPPQLINLKEKNAVSSFRVTIRDREHFYRIVNWLNKNIGKGSDKWSMEGRPLKLIKRGQQTNSMIYIFSENFDPATSVYLSLI